MVEQSEGDESTAFVRQRRDLFVISSILVVGLLADVQVKKLAIFGTELEVGHSPVFSYAAWFLWAYWLLRYWQSYRETHFRDVKVDYTDVCREMLDRAFEARVEQATINIMLGHPEIANGLNAGTATLAPPTRVDRGVERDVAWVDWIPNFKLQTGEIIALTQTRTRIHGLQLWELKTKAVTVLCLNRLTFTEYIFPFIFAAFPVVIVIFMKVQKFF
jgi:hypothetical protein